MPNLENSIELPSRVDVESVLGVRIVSANNHIEDRALQLQQILHRHDLSQDQYQTAHLQITFFF